MDKRIKNKIVKVEMLETRNIGTHVGEKGNVYEVSFEIARKLETLGFAKITNGEKTIFKKVKK